jgi:hypothetical protein
MLCKMGENGWAFAAASTTGAQKRNKYVLFIVLYFRLCAHIFWACLVIRLVLILLLWSLQWCMLQQQPVSMKLTHNSMTLVVWFSHICSIIFPGGIQHLLAVCRSFVYVKYSFFHKGLKILLCFQVVPTYT